jgi:hypothetical protein
MTLARSLAALVFVLALPMAGCSFAQLHGYEVAHSNMDVEYRPGPIGLRTSSEGPVEHVQERFDASLRSSLAASASEFQLVAPSERPRHTVHVRLLDVVQDTEVTRVRGEVDIHDRNGSVSSQLRIDLTVPAESGEEAMNLAGVAFGERVGDYLRNRERYHW